jgi:hypothetical protein|tara:strand:+ start:311 stop:529 length:219 start_codon:yes stop_codon:yes gene_type:complete
MKYLLTIFLFLSINAFTEDDNYVVCYKRQIESLTKCVNDYIDKGYKPLSGLRAYVYQGKYSYKNWFQALHRE